MKQINIVLWTLIALMLVAHALTSLLTCVPVNPRAGDRCDGRCASDQVCLFTRTGPAHTLVGTYYCHTPDGGE